MRRGEVWLAELEPRSGSEQRGVRPVVVVSRDALNRVSTWRSINVVPLSTSARQAIRGPTVVLVPAGEAGLERDGVAVGHQITTLDRGKLSRCLGTLSPGVLADVERCLKVALDLA
jgi:mRNA interferase MazF